MNSVFNTPFEISLRTLLTLEVAGEQWKTADMIAAADFITVYSKVFGYLRQIYTVTMTSNSVSLLYGANW